MTALSPTGTNSTPRTPEHLFTWVDVDEHLAVLGIHGLWPDWLQEASAWWEQLDLTIDSGTSASTVQTWLDGAFGAGSIEEDAHELRLILDRPAPSKVFLRVELTEQPPVPAERRRSPLLRERSIDRSLLQPLARPTKDAFPHDVNVIAFHSFKGGVGRTVHAVAMADALARQGNRVLLVDADLEAPGITSMHRAQGGQFDFCFEDMLALLQGEQASDWKQTVQVGVAYLPNQRIGRYPDGGEVTLIPSSRRSRLGAPRIEPVDLLSPQRSAYLLTEALADLAAAIGSDTVVIDLRAGASEISAPVLLDPRVQRIWVTTLSHQSVEGTERLIRQLSRQAPAVAGVDPATSVVITQYRTDSHGPLVRAAEERLRGAILDSWGPYPADDLPDDVASEVLPAPLLSPFREELLALPSTWDGVIQAIAQSQVRELLLPIMPSAPEAAGEPGAIEADTEGTSEGLSRRRESLERTAKSLVYAETADNDSAEDFLATEPLRRLIGDHRTESPIALVVGAKGAGKTFTYVRACAAGTWAEFALRTGVDDVRLDVPIVPALESVNLTNSLQDPQDLRDRFARGLGQEQGGHAGEIRISLQDLLHPSGPQDPSAWRKQWLSALARAAGIDPGESPEDALVALGKRSRAVFLIDGLEDLLGALDNDVKRTALRVLLIDVLEWLRAMRSRPLGLIVFVRRDLVSWAIRQNIGQLLARYEPYALKWDKVEALRLALWVAVSARVLPTPDAPISDLSYDDLVGRLRELWGRKMGSEKSKEARSHLWVPAALADFKEQVQARDVVMFLHEAARLSRDPVASQQVLNDRLLLPTAMRKALPACSRNKIEAIQQENQEVGDLLLRLQRLEGVTVPFPLDQVGLTAEEVELLENAGVLSRGDDGRYWVPEIYRHGLGFGSERRARVLWERTSVAP